MPLPNEPTSRFAVERCAPHVLRWHIACPHDPGLMEHKEYLRIIYAAFCIRMAELCGEEVKVRVGRRVPGTCNFSLEFRFPRSKFGTPTKEEHAEVMGEGAFDGMGSTGFGAFGLDMEGGLGGVM